MNFNARYQGVRRNPKGKGWQWFYILNPFRSKDLPRTKTLSGVAPSERKARAALYDFFRKRRAERDRIEQLARAAADKRIGSRDAFEKSWNAVYWRFHANATRRSKVLGVLG